MSEWVYCTEVSEESLDTFDRQRKLHLEIEKQKWAYALSCFLVFYVFVFCFSNAFVFFVGFYVFLCANLP